jgi:hypothetical protein
MRAPSLTGAAHFLKPELFVMDSDTLKMFANFAATKIALGVAGALMTAGWLAPSQETQFETIIGGVIVGALASLWSWWNLRGKELVLAELARAHGVASSTASTTTASNAIIAKVSANSVVATSAGAAKIL